MMQATKLYLGCCLAAAKITSHPRVQSVGSFVTEDVHHLFKEIDIDNVLATGGADNRSESKSYDTYFLHKPAQLSACSKGTMPSLDEQLPILQNIVNVPSAFSALALVMVGAYVRRWHSIVTGRQVKSVGGQAASCLRWAHTLLGMYTQVFQFTLTLRWGLQGICISAFYQFAINVVLDVIISDAPWENFKSLRRNGYNNWHIVGSFCSCQFVWSLNSAMAWYFVPEFEAAGRPAVLVSLVLSLAVAEFVFTTMHIKMHEVMMFGEWAHKFHHCCLNASLSSNYLFTPLDGLIESFGPWLSAWGVYKFIVQDSFGLWVSLYVIQQWYMLDHDENIRTPHFFHHKHVDAEYTAYSSIKFKNVKDELRWQIKRHD